MYQQTKLPRWRGFNLTGMFASKTSAYNSIDPFTGGPRYPGYFYEDDFRMIADFGFNFIRLPLSYRVWSSVDDPFTIDEKKLAPLDQAVEWSEKYGLHANICMHRLPGYCINKDEAVEEKLDLWHSDEAQAAAQFQWTTIAERYADISADRLSFNLVNEPESFVTPLDYYRLADKIFHAVHDITPDRLFIVDGLRWGQLPPVDIMCDFPDCAFSCRGYSPESLTHYGVKPEFTEVPQWPGSIQGVSRQNEISWNRGTMDRYHDLWASLGQSMNVGVHCGEFGCYNRTPHDVTLAWMEDELQSLQERNIGFALWNFRGSFGVMDSGRTDVDYEKVGNHLLDRKMLALLMKY